MPKRTTWSELSKSVITEKEEPGTTKMKHGIAGLNFYTPPTPIVKQPSLLSRAGSAVKEGAVGAVLDTGALMLRAVPGGPLSPMDQAQMAETGETVNRTASRALTDAGQRYAEMAEKVNPGLLPRTIRGVTRSLGTAVPATIAAGPAGAIATAVGSTGVQAEREAEKAGFTGLGKAAYIGTEMAVEGVPAAVMQAAGLGGAEKVLGDLVGPGREAAKQGLAAALKQLGKQSLNELGEEYVTELGHALTQSLAGVREATPQSILETVRDTTLQTVGTMGLVGSPSVARGAYNSLSGEPPAPPAPPAPTVPLQKPIDPTAPAAPTTVTQDVTSELQAIRDAVATVDPSKLAQFPPAPPAATAAPVAPVAPARKPRKDAVGVAQVSTPEILAAVEPAAASRNLPKEILLSIMKHESAANPNALSPAGAKGWFQFMDATGEEVAAKLGLGPHDPTNLQQQAAMAADYFGSLVEKHNGDYGKALEDWNFGPAAAAKRRASGKPMPVETQKFRKKVLRDAGVEAVAKAAGATETEVADVKLEAKAENLAKVVETQAAPPPPVVEVVTTEAGTPAYSVEGIETESIEEAQELHREARQERMQEFAETVLWHVSPQTFETFDASKIGTGLGRSLEGYGLYFTTRKETVDYYKSVFGESSNVYTTKTSAAPETLINWDESLEKQSATVQAAFQELVADSGIVVPEGISAGELYDKIAGEKPGADFEAKKKELSATLQTKGVVGGKFAALDQEGEWDGESYNYVIFDDKALYDTQRVNSAAELAAITPPPAPVESDPLPTAETETASDLEIDLTPFLTRNKAANPRVLQQAADVLTQTIREMSPEGQEWVLNRLKLGHPVMELINKEDVPEQYRKRFKNFSAFNSKGSVFFFQNTGKPIDATLLKHELVHAALSTLKHKKVDVLSMLVDPMRRDTVDMLTTVAQAEPELRIALATAVQEMKNAADPWAHAEASVHRFEPVDQVVVKYGLASTFQEAMAIKSAFYASHLENTEQAAKLKEEALAYQASVNDSLFSDVFTMVADMTDVLKEDAKVAMVKAELASELAAAQQKAEQAREIARALGKKEPSSKIVAAMRRASEEKLRTTFDGLNQNLKQRRISQSHEMAVAWEEAFPDRPLYQRLEERPVEEVLVITTAENLEQNLIDMGLNPKERAQAKAGIEPENIGRIVERAMSLARQKHGVNNPITLARTLAEIRALSDPAITGRNDFFLEVEPKKRAAKPWPQVPAAIQAKMDKPEWLRAQPDLLRDFLTGRINGEMAAKLAARRAMQGAPPADRARQGAEWYEELKENPDNRAAFDFLQAQGYFANRKMGLSFRALFDESAEDTQGGASSPTEALIRSVKILRTMIAGAESPEVRTQLQGELDKILNQLALRAQELSGYQGSDKSDIAGEPPNENPPPPKRRHPADGILGQVEGVPIEIRRSETMNPLRRFFLLPTAVHKDPEAKEAALDIIETDMRATQEIGADHILLENMKRQLYGKFSKLKQVTARLRGEAAEREVSRLVRAFRKMSDAEVAAEIQKNPTVANVAIRILDMMDYVWKPAIIEGKRQLYRDQLDGKQYNAFIDVVDRGLTVKAAAKANKVTQKQLQMRIDDYNEILNWKGIDDYVTNIESGHLYLVDQKGTVRAHAVDRAHAIEKATELLKADPTIEGLTLKTEAPLIESAGGQVTARQYRYLVGKHNAALKKAAGDIDAAVRKELASKMASVSAKLVQNQAVIPFKFAPALAEREDVLLGEPNLFRVLGSYSYSVRKKLEVDPLIARTNKLLDRRKDLHEESRTALRNQLEAMKGRYWLEDQIADSTLQFFANMTAWSSGKVLGKNRQIELFPVPFAASRFSKRTRRAVSYATLGGRPFAGIINGLTASKNLHTEVGPKIMLEASRWLRTPAGKAAIQLEEWRLGMDFVTESSGRQHTQERWYNPLKMFNWTEPHTRRMSLASGYLLARNKLGMDEAAAWEYAGGVVRTTNFLYATAALPEIMRSPSTRAIFQFKSYYINELHRLARVARHPGMLVREILGATLIGGPRLTIATLKAFPIVGMILGAMGLDWLDEMMVKFTPEWISRGALGAAGLEATSALAAQAPSTAEDILGIQASHLMQMWGAIEPMFWKDDKGGGAIVAGENARRLPGKFVPGLKNYMDAYHSIVDKDGWMLDGRGNKLYKANGLWDSFLIGIGAVPTDEDQARRAVYETNQQVAKINEVKRAIAARALREVREDGRISDETMDAIALHGGVDLTGSMETQALPPMVRELRQAPTSLRPEVLERFQQYQVR